VTARLTPWCPPASYFQVVIPVSSEKSTLVSDGFFDGPRFTSEAKIPRTLFSDDKATRTLEASVLRRKIRAAIALR
jgi:hypothetical protein